MTRSLVAMTLGEVEAYLHRHIPISAAMGVRVVACDDAGATLAAPLAPNINHRATAFGGSVSAVGILVAWTWLHAALRAAGHPSRLVIHTNTVAYLAPIAGEFEARCEAPARGTFEKFLKTLKRHGRARLMLVATLTTEGKKAATFEGEYVAIDLRKTEEGNGGN